jgi:hypothetical protein
VVGHEIKFRKHELNMLVVNSSNGNRSTWKSYTGGIIWSKKMLHWAMNILSDSEILHVNQDTNILQPFLA